MSQIKQKFLLDDSVNGAKILLENNQSLRALNSQTSSVEILRVNASDYVEFQRLPVAPFAPTIGHHIVNKDYVDFSFSNVVLTSQVGAADGVAPLGNDGLVPSNYLPAIAITDVFVVADLNERDALLTNPSMSIDTGDVVIVLSDSNYANSHRSYIYDGSQYQVLYTTTNGDGGGGGSVISVNSQTGVVVLDTDDVGEGTTNLYFTATRAQDAVITSDMSGTSSTKSPSVAAIKTYLGNSFQKEKFILTLSDVNLGYVTLSGAAQASSIAVFVDRLALHATDDYTITTVSGLTRLTWAGTVAKGGIEELEAGDIIHVSYNQLT